MEESKDNIQRPFKGMVTDVSPSDQPKETYRYALNAVNKAEVGNSNFLSMEKAVTECTTFPAGTKLLHSQYMTDDLIAVWLVDNSTSPKSTSYIGTVDKLSKYTNHVITQELDLSEDYQINSTFRIRQNNAKVIYWVDGKNKSRLYNFNRPFDFYSIEYETWNDLPLPKSPFSGEQWENIKFDLIKSYTSIPNFDKAEILNSGNIPSGTYNVSIQLLDENLSPTEWITTSNPVSIFVDPLELGYASIRGSRNSTSSAQNFQYASKSIQWTFGNFDQNFAFYRVAVLIANGGTGLVNKVLVSNLIPIDDTTFIYSGNDGDFTTTPLSDIMQTKIDIDSAKYIEQLENRLILAGIKGKQIEWCKFQEKASKITAKVVTETTSTDDITNLGNAKNPLSSFQLTGYMYGEVYSFGIVYIFKDGFKSPAYHIPGRTSGASGTGMDFYQCDVAEYPSIHSCTSYNYWGKDGYDGSKANLVGSKIRHHKFPLRTTDLYTKSSIDTILPDTKELTLLMHFDNPVSHLTPTVHICEVIIQDSVTFDILEVKEISIAEPYYADMSFYINSYPKSSNPTIQDVSFTDGHTISAFTSSESVVTSSHVTSIESIVTETCGIKFSNIERPHPDVIGFEIVRNDRTDDDKIVVDNVIIGELTSDNNDINNPYNAFGLLLPDSASTKKSTKGIYIFSPEHQFRNKKLNFDSIIVHGAYTRVGKFIPLATNGEDGNGVYIQDVQAGTSFNSTYNKGEDPDGFDLQILYRSSDLVYTTISGITIPLKEKLFYLSAAGNMVRDEDIFFNASIDNKIMIMTFSAEDEIDPTIFSSNGNERVLYASLIVDNKTAYSNFMNRIYYKEHNNVNLFASDIVESQEIFNGDSYVAPMTINSSTFYDTHIAVRDKKSKVWKIILGSVLIIAAIAVNIIPGVGQAVSVALGTLAATILTAVTVLAISYGVSTLISGIEFETMKNMIDQHYEAGLKITIQDNDNKDDNYKNGSQNDDRFEWFVDRLQNVYFESSVNIGLRSGLTISTSDFVNSPTLSLSNNIVARESYEVYLMNKFTVIDREQNSGRLYLGYAMAEFYDINLDYLRKNHEKPEYHLPIEYDCCSSKIEDFANRVHYSEQSFQEEKLDNFRSFLVNNYKDIEGQFGRITNIFRFNNTLYIHTTESLLVLPQNLQERINQELVTFIGTGEFFSILPRKIIDGENGSFGSSDNKATVVTRNGVFFVNTKEGIPYLLGQRPENIGVGNSIWFKENLKIKLHDSLTNLLGESYEPSNNVISSNSVGVHTVYDSKLNRIIITKIDYVPTIAPVLYSKFGSQTGKLIYNPLTNKFTINGSIVPFTNADQFENKSWTMSFSLETQSWISYHSYLPRIYVNTSSELYSSIGNKLYKHHDDTKFCVYYGVKYPHIIEYVSVSNPLVTRIFDTVSLIVQGRKYLSTYKTMIDDNTAFFDKVIFSNLRQCSGEVNIIVRDNTTNTYLLNAVKNIQNSLTTERIEEIWHLNEIRDHIIDYTKPFYLSSWIDIKSNYPIDKVLNQVVLNSNKQWYEMESLRDNHLLIRLIFSNFGDNNIQLTTNYSIENEQQSLR